MIEYEVEIAKPLREVYAAFNDPDNMPRWLTGLQRTEQISGEPGQVGSVSKQIYLERGRIVEMVETITAHEAERFFEGNLEGPGVNGQLRVEFIDRGERTGVRFASDMKGTGFFSRLMMPLMKGTIRKRQAGDLDRFKELVEAGEL